MTTAIKLALRPLYRRSTTFQFVVRALRRPGIFRAAKADGPPFIGDVCLRQTVEYILAEGGITQFVETGTYLGHTCRYVAARYPTLPVITLESNADFFAASRSVLRRFQNVTQLYGNSARTLQQALQNGLIQGCPLFFLDAHWYDYLPLPEEIQSIGKYLGQAVVLIHDFQIPGWPEFGFDVCNGIAIGPELLQAAQAADKTYDVFFPRHSAADAYPALPQLAPPLRGFALVFQGMPDAAAQFAQSEHAVRYMRQSL